MKKFISILVFGYTLAWGGWLSGQLKCNVDYTVDGKTKTYQLPVWGALADGWANRLVDGSAVMTECFQK